MLQANQHQHEDNNLKSIKNNLCTFCGKMGHTENDCFKKKRILQEQLSKEEQDDNDQMRMELNEVIKSKPRTSQIKSITLNSQHQDLLKAIGKINGHNAKVIFDSGAMCSVISMKLAKEFQIDITDEEVDVVLADGRKEKAFFSEQVSINIFGITVEVKMIILDNND